MTCFATSSEGQSPSAPHPFALVTLVRLLAREAAQSDFATRCNVSDREA